jgi:hypothetical protein
VAEHPAARLIQHEIPQRPVAGDEVALLPQSRARRRLHASDDHIADFAFGMAGYGMDRSGASHDRLISPNALKLQFTRRRIESARNSHPDGFESS